VALALEHAGVEQAVDIGDAHRAIAGAAFVGGDFDQRLEPIHAARARAHDLDLSPSLFEGLAEGARDLLGADAERTGIAGDEDAGAQLCASFTRASIFASSSLP